MRIAFIGQDNAFSNTALAPLLLPYDPRWEIALIITACTRVGMFRQHKLESHGANRIPRLWTTNVNSGAVHDQLRRKRIDVALCVGSDRLFTQETLETVPRGFLNVHPSALPHLRGPCPIFWSVKQGLSIGNVTLHFMDAKEDHGPIIDVRPFKIAPRTTYDELHQTASDAAIPMIRDAFLRLVEHRLQSIPQDHTRATRAPRPKSADVRIDPEQWDIEPLANFIQAARGLRTPWMHAGDETFYFDRALITEPHAKIPGSHVRMADRLLLQCRDGVLHTRIQVAK